MESFIQYVLPAIVLFIAQTVLCLWCKNKHARLVPTVIAGLLSLGHLGNLLGSIRGPWFPIHAMGTLMLTAVPPLAAVGFGWAIYIVKLIIQEIKELKR